MTQIQTSYRLASTALVATLLIMLVACGESDTGTVEASAPGVTETHTPSPITPAPLTPAPIADVAEAREAMMSPERREEGMAAYLNLASDEDMRDLSGRLWSGRGMGRDREMAARLALAAFEADPQSWSALRSGVAMVDGTGLDVDNRRAVNVLSHPVVSENATALFYKGLAHARLGETERARAAYEDAADRGNARAQGELDKLQ